MSDLDKEERVEIGSVPARMLMALDGDGNRRFLRCDEDGFLLCRVVQTDEAEFEVTD